MGHLMLPDIVTFLDPRFKDCKEDDHKKKKIEEIIKLAVTIDDTIAESEIQVADNGPVVKKSKLGKFLVKKYGIGVMQSDNSSNSNTVSRLTPLEKANNGLSNYLQYSQLEIETYPLNW